MLQKNDNENVITTTFYAYRRRPVLPDAQAFVLGNMLYQRFVWKYMFYTLRK